MWPAIRPQQQHEVGFGCVDRVRRDGGEPRHRYHSLHPLLRGRVLLSGSSTIDRYFSYKGWTGYLLSPVSGRILDLVSFTMKYFNYMHISKIKRNKM